MKPELKLTPGKGIEDLTCSVEDLLDSVVKSNKVCKPLLHPGTGALSYVESSLPARQLHDQSLVQLNDHILTFCVSIINLAHVL